MILSFKSYLNFEERRHLHLHSIQRAAKVCNRPNNDEPQVACLPILQTLEAAADAAADA